MALKYVQNMEKKIRNIYNYYVIKTLFYACYRIISPFLKYEITTLFSEKPVLLPILMNSLQI